MSGALTGRVALVTGAARGQGRSHAIRLAAEGADIIAFDLCAPPAAGLGYPPSTPADLDETADAVLATGRRIVARIGDVRDQAALDAAVAVGVDAFGGLDIVVANAGIVSWSRFWEMSDNAWSAVIDINLTGAWRTLRAAAPTLIEQGRGGSIIVVSSVAGIKALPGEAHYTAAKHGLVGLTKAAAIELGPYDVRVNSIHPWGVDTPMAKNDHMDQVLAEHPTYLASFGSIQAHRPIAQPSDISDTVLFLASDASRYITGAQIPVDMGATVV